MSKINARGGSPQFREYLEKERFTKSSAKSYSFQAKKFTQWLEKQDYNLIRFDYKKALLYVDYLQKRHTNITTINSKITATRRYFDYLLEAAHVSENPFTDILVRGNKTKKVLHNLLSFEELEDLYYSYPIDERLRVHSVLANKRNRTMLGLMVYQGLSTTDMKRPTL